MNADFLKQVSSDAARKLRAQRSGNQGVWFGLGMSGLIGWSVAVPTLCGAMLGIWIDRRFHSSHSWTLALLIVGLCVGCANAWYWVSQQNDLMHEAPPKDEKGRHV
jgi:ATP synthase protein I